MSTSPAPWGMQDADRQQDVGAGVTIIKTWGGAFQTKGEVDTRRPGNP